MTPDEWTPELRYRVARILTRRISGLGATLETVMCARDDILCRLPECLLIEEAMGVTLKSLQRELELDDA